jgi:hypothetical protein
MDTTIPALTNQSNERNRRPIRGGVILPQSLVTAHTNTGFAWRIRHGHLSADTLGIHNFVDLRTVADWPLYPETLIFYNLHGELIGGLHIFLPALSVAEAWPWEDAGGRSSVISSSGIFTPLMQTDINNDNIQQKYSIIDRLQNRIPDFQQRLDEKVGQLRNWPLPDHTMRQQLQHREQLYVLPELEQRQEERLDRLRDRLPPDWNSDGRITPF